MNDLRGALIVLGAVFLAGLFLWERRRSARRGGVSLPESPPDVAGARPRRVEPSIGEFGRGGGTDLDREDEDSIEVPTIHPVDSVRVQILPEAAVDVPAAVQVPPARDIELSISGPATAPVVSPAPAAIQWPPAQIVRVLNLRVVRSSGEPLPGRLLRQALEAAGMVHGPQQIFHLADATGAVRVSAANLMRPGSFEPAAMDAQEFRGLSLFSVLPGPRAPELTLETLVHLARDVAARLDAVVQDDRGAPLDAAGVARLRASLQPQPGPAAEHP